MQQGIRVLAFGKFLVGSGLLIAAGGLLVWWGVPIGRLPGDLVVRRGAGESRGVVLFRIEGRSQATARRVVEAIASRDDWAGHFSVVEPARIRMRALAPGLAKD